MFRKKYIFEELDSPINLIVKTYCPEKWILIDKETNQIYQGNPGGFWDKIEVKKKNNEI